MVQSCVLCGSTSSAGNVVLHSFPKNPLRLGTWLTGLNLSESNIKFSSARICSKHFSDRQYEFGTGHPIGSPHKKLKSNAFPDIIIRLQNQSSNQYRKFSNAETQTDLSFTSHNEVEGVFGSVPLTDKCLKRTYCSPGSSKQFDREPSVKRRTVNLQVRSQLGPPLADSVVDFELNDVSAEAVESCENYETEYLIDESFCFENPNVHEKNTQCIDEHDDNVSFDDYNQILQNLEQSTARISITENVRPGYAVNNNISAEEPRDKTKKRNNHSHPFNSMGPVINYDFITEEELHYLTGYSKNQFEYIYCLVMRHANGANWPYYSMSLKNQLHLTLIKFRMNFDYRFFAILFRITEQMASKIFKFWLKMLDETLNGINFWHLGAKGEHLYRVVIDCSEFMIEKPSDIIKQQVTWSTYKHRNTFKVMVGIDENGLIIFVSPLFGGSATDDTIVEKSGLLDLLQKGDYVLADRGFETSDLMAEKGIILNKPPSKKGEQLSEAEVATTRAVASRRVEVERLIGLTKDNRILAQRISRCLFPFANKIVNVIFKLTNVKRPICKGISQYEPQNETVDEETSACL